MKNFKIIILFLFLLTPIFVFAQEVKNGDIIINEVMWGGSEWIELYNTTDREIQIDNWSIDNAKSGRKPLINISGKIPADGYFLICNNEYVNKIKCDFPNSDLSLIDLPDSNGDLILKDKNGIVIDTAVGDKWPKGKKTGSGENTKYYSMERINPNVSGSEKCNWDTAKEENSFSI
ncbi:MAG: lamin tail domain-containing protein, partial [Candidatus Pacebacteria bacterium]|nr:lamin tail domain-containing protein [Candidatus Paceibacterota bacterium]